MPSAQGRGLLLKGYRYDRWDRGSNVWSAALFGHRQNVCVCFTFFLKFLLMPARKVSPAGSFVLSIASWLAFAMKEPYLGESLLEQEDLVRKVIPFTCVFPVPESAVSCFVHTERWGRVVRSAPCTAKTLSFCYGGRYNTTRHHWGGHVDLGPVPSAAASGVWEVSASQGMSSFDYKHRLGRMWTENGFEWVICDERIHWGLLTQGPHWANSQSERFCWLGWPQLTDWEIPCFQELFQTLLLLQAYWFYCNSQRITSDITTEQSKED